MTFKEAYQYLNSFINYEKNLKEVSPVDFRLDRVKNLLAAVGNPQREIPVIHVAGSKGKGSTCVFLAHILKCANYRVGLYTSPHIHNVRERIRILGQGRDRGNEEIFPDMISEDEFAEIIGELKCSVEAHQFIEQFGELTFFEVLTVAALYFFNKQGVDFIVLETGLGGRLDATNAVDSIIAAVTPISLEHTHMLGETIEEITNEKAAIIKNSYQRVCLAPQEKESLKILKERCQQFSITPVVIGENIQYESINQTHEKQIFSIHSAFAQYKDLQIRLAGSHQLVNASLAIGIIEQLGELGYPVSTEGIFIGFEQTHWPIRFEVIKDNPKIILDGAHNTSSSNALVDTIEKVFPKSDVTMIMGFSQQKDTSGMCKAFNRITKKVIATKSHHPRALEVKADEIKKYFPNKACYQTQGIKEALDLAQKDLKKDDIVLVSGSLYLVSEARALCTN